ncbi:MAG: amino acid permease [Candidatus Obscuribacterales bacterium]|nr:amino acid permease [Candidatus Obscuribacterales bacterium]
MSGLTTWLGKLWKDATRTVDFNKLEQHEEAEAHGLTMARSLGLVSLVFMAIANIIGAGIFVTTGTAAHDFAGPSIPLSYAIAGIIVGVPAALCYAELASRVRGNGSAVSYAYGTIGELAGFLIGFDLLLEMTIGSAAVAAGWAANFTNLLRLLFGVELPEAWRTSPKEVNFWLLAATMLLFAVGAWLANVSWKQLMGKSVAWFRNTVVSKLAGFIAACAAFGLLAFGVRQAAIFFQTTESLNWPAAGIVILITLFLLRGVNHTAKATVYLVIIKVVVLVVFVGIAVCFFNPSNLQPFTHPEWGWWGTVRAAGVVFFAFVGFETITASAAECKDPQRDLPKAILWGLGICTAIYMVVSLVLVAAVSYTELSGSEAAAPMSKALNILGFSWGSIFVSFGSLVSLVSVLLVSNYGLSRIARALAKFGVLPAFLGTLTKRTQVPFWSTVISGVCVALATLLLPVEELFELCNIGTLGAFAVVCLSVIMLRRKNPNSPSRFRCPGYPYVPIFGALACLGMMLMLPALSWLRLAIWMAIGFTWYVLRGRYNSILNRPY